MTDPKPQSATPRGFVFERDSFAFANELVWEYRFDPAGGRPLTTRRHPSPTYAHRCFVLARSARQFLYHASFRPELPPLRGEDYQSLIRAVVRRNPRVPCPTEQRVELPGYDGLRSFSRDWEALLKAGCGGAWQSYALRSHWRMVFPISRRHQERTARQLVARLNEGGVPVVHLVSFPRLTINHGMVVYGWAKSDAGVHFTAYDPNAPDTPAKLEYREATRSFAMARNRYWMGGPLNVIEIYRGWAF